VPHLRFTRDRRGYENTFLVRADRAPGRDRPAILYWFRSPPDIRVGRIALDPGTIRALEREHPHVRFDWPRLLEAAEAASAAGRESAPNAQMPPPRRQLRPRRRSPDPPRSDSRGAGHPTAAPREQPAPPDAGDPAAAPPAPAPDTVEPAAGVDDGGDSAGSSSRTSD